MMVGLLTMAAGCSSVQTTAPAAPAAPTYQMKESMDGKSVSGTATADRNLGSKVLQKPAVVDRTTAKLPILMYHSIADVPGNPNCVAPDRLREQLQYLKETGYQAISFQDVKDWYEGKPLPEKPILLTLDDGYRDNYSAAFPILKELNMKATIFMTTGNFTKPNFLSEEMVKEMAASGWIEFGAHTVHHYDLTKQPPDVHEQEVKQSKADLERLLGVPILAFAYPYGNFTDKTIEYVKQAGYEFAVTSYEALADIRRDVLLLDRIWLAGTYTTEEFQKMFP
jgi:peptidoglycan/xylan/chitin deacetylase (PgdA/CDA1 family)